MEKKDEDSPPARPSSKFDSAKPAFNDGITIGQIADHRSIGRLPGGNNMGNNPRPARKGIVIYKLLFVSCRCKNVGKVERTNRKTKSKNQQTGQIGIKLDKRAMRQCSAMMIFICVKSKRGYLLELLGRKTFAAFSSP